MPVTATVPPVEVPVRVRSAATKPVTGSLKVTEYRIGSVFVGSAWPAFWFTVTVGGVVSTVKVFALLVPVLPAVSVWIAWAV